MTETLSQIWIRAGEFERAYRFMEGRVPDNLLLCQAAPYFAEMLLESTNEMKAGDERTARLLMARNLVRKALPALQEDADRDRGNPSVVLPHSRALFALNRALMELDQPEDAMAVQREISLEYQGWKSSGVVPQQVLRVLVESVALLERKTAAREDLVDTSPVDQDLWDLMGTIFIEQGRALERDNVKRIGVSLIDLGVRTASGRRKFKNWNEARRVAAKIESIADSLISLYPNEAFAHEAKCIAQQQVVKNLREKPRFGEIKAGLSLAIQSARRAAELDPSNEKAREREMTLTRRHDAIHFPTDPTPSLTPPRLVKSS